MTREKKIPAPEGYPLFGWTPTTVKAHLQAQPPGVGDAMIIYNAHGGFHAYSLAMVVTSRRPAKAHRALQGRQLGRHRVLPQRNQRVHAQRSHSHDPAGARAYGYLASECDVVLDLPPYAQEPIL